MDKYCSGCDSWKSPASFAERSSRCRDCKAAADKKRAAAKKAGTYSPKPRGPRGPYLTAARRADREIEDLAIGLEDARRAIDAIRELPMIDADGADVFDAHDVLALLASIPAPSGDVLTAQCGSCGRTRVFDDFPRDPRSVSGRSHDCDDCAAAKGRERLEQDAATARYFEAERERVRLAAERSAAAACGHFDDL